MEIYVVTSGSYSDYHIEAVFTDLAKAEAFVAIRNIPNKYLAEDYGISTFEADVPDTSFRGWMAEIREGSHSSFDTEGETVKEVVLSPEDRQSLAHVFRADEMNKNLHGIKGLPRWKNDEWFAVGYGRTAEAALQTARQAMAELKAREAGIA